MQKISFGYIYDFRNPAPWRRPPAGLYAELLDFIVWTESLGFEGAWVPEHHLADDDYLPSPLIALAAIAARTKTMKIGSAIALAPLYHPVRFAEDCAVIDVLSNGRLEMAVGIGYRRRETDAYGVSFAGRGVRTDEFLDIVRRLWAGETVTFQGRHFSIKDAAISPRPVNGHIPLFVGGFSDKALERAVRYGDGFHGEPAAYERYVATLEAHGRSRDEARIRTANLLFFVAEDPDAARDELAPYVHFVNESYGRWLREDAQAGQVGYDERFVPMSLDQFKASGSMRILTPDRAIDTLRRLHQRAPVEHFCMLVPPGLPLDRFAKYAQLFAERVIPAFR